MQKQDTIPFLSELEKLEALGSLEIIAKSVVEGFITGLHKSPFHGFSVEFAEHRLYNKGESTRHIDWKLYGRTDRLYIKKYEEETNLRCQIVLDTSSSMYFPEEPLSKLRFSVYTAAALVHLFRKQRDATGLSIFSDHLEDHLQARLNHAHIQLIYNKLNDCLNQSPKSRKTASAEVIHQLAESIHKRSLVVIFSDAFSNMNDTEALFQALQHLKYKNHEVIFFHVLDNELEMELNYKNRLYRFIDNETGERIELYPDEVRKSYQEEITSFKSAIKQKCTQYKIDYIDADIRKGFYPVLQAYLIKRARLY